MAVVGVVSDLVVVPVLPHHHPPSLKPIKVITIVPLLLLSQLQLVVDSIVIDGLEKRLEVVLYSKSSVARKKKALMSHP